MTDDTFLTDGSGRGVTRRFFTDVVLLVTSSGNEFILDIASTICDGFRGADVSCTVLTDTLPEDWPSTRVTIVVAPHEFFPLFAEPRGLPCDAVLSQSYVLNVEQPGSQWFDVAWRYARQSRGVIDISQEGARTFRERGLNATVLLLGWVPAMESQASAPPMTRAYDLLFLGHASDRRNRFFARHAATFSALRARLIFADVRSIRTSITPGYVAGPKRLELFASSRIVLNVHSTDRRYFESHRAVLALANKCVFVTEHSRGIESMTSGVELVAGELDDLPALCTELIDDAARLEAIASAGYEHVRRHRSMAASCRAVLDWLANREASVEVTIRTDAVSLASRRGYVIRQLATSREARKQGQAICDIEPNAAYARSDRVSISVVITLYNYERYIEECLESVLRSQGVDAFEIVIVDDGSTDGSAARAMAAACEASRPVRLLRKHANTGLADARNCGIAHARGDAIFILDADNWIYPSCLAVLHSALRQRGFAAVYGIIQRFLDDTGEGAGLLSEFEWNVAALVRQPYIDAMAMFDRAALVAAGGYSEELIEHGWFGWEDYDLWLKLAQADQSCGLVPNILSAYRVHAASMLQHTNQTLDGLARHFHQKFASLVRLHPGLDMYFGVPVPVPVPPPPEPSFTQRDLDAQAADYERRLDAIRASYSWKVTVPLRLAFRLFTGRRR